MAVIMTAWMNTKMRFQLLSNPLPRSSLPLISLQKPNWLPLQQWRAVPAHPLCSRLLLRAQTCPHPQFCPPPLLLHRLLNGRHFGPVHCLRSLRLRKLCVLWIRLFLPRLLLPPPMSHLHLRSRRLKAPMRDQWHLKKAVFEHHPLASRCKRTCSHITLRVYAGASSRQPLVAVKDASALYVVFIFELVAVVSLHCSKQWKGAGGECLFESKHWGCLDARSAFKFCKNKLFSNLRAWATLSRRRRRAEYDDFSYSRLGGESNEHARRRTRVYNRPQRGKISFRCGVLIGATAHESADDVVCERGVHAL